MTVIPDSIPMTDPYADDPAFTLHVGGKLAIAARVAVDGPEDLALAYTPGVGRVSQAIADEPDRVWRYTGRSNAVAVLSNGTAVLGLGDIGPEAAMPVMEGKAILFKQFGDVDAYPICVNARTVDEVVAIGIALGTDLRWHQPRRHQGPGVLRDRTSAPGGTRHPGVPRRPTRHGDRRARRVDQRRRGGRQAVRVAARGGGRHRRRGRGRGTTPP